jgi:hypothetical protein
MKRKNFNKQFTVLRNKKTGVFSMYFNFNVSRYTIKKLFRWYKIAD